MVNIFFKFLNNFFNFLEKSYVKNRVFNFLEKIFFNKNNLEHSTHANNDIKNRTTDITLLVVFGGSKLETLNNLIDHSLKIYRKYNYML
jgi:hypothetical protein